MEMGCKQALFLESNWTIKHKTWAYYQQFCLKKLILKKQLGKYQNNNNKITKPTDILLNVV